MFIDAIINNIRPRPALYLGECNITKLRAFLDGYQTALYDFDIPEDDRDALLPLSFWFFHEYVARCFGYIGSTAGWCNMILDQTDHDEEKGLCLFFTLYDEFMQLKIARIFTADLSSANKTHHITDKYAPRRMTGEHYNIAEPMYKNPISISYAQLTNDAGHESYICIVQTETERIIEDNLYSNEANVIKYFEQCFGAVNWREQSCGAD